MSVLLYDIFMFFQDDPKLLQKGEMIFQTGQIFNVKYNKCVVSCFTSTNQQKNTYKTTVTISNGAIFHFNCTCQRGKFKCQHLAALLIYINKNINADNVFELTENASTDTSPTNMKLMTAEQIFQFNDDFDPLDREVNTEDKEFMYNALRDQPIGFSWLLSPDVTNSHIDDIPTIQDVLLSSELRHVQDKVDYILSAIKLTDVQLLSIAKSTIGQRENPLWCKYRANRLTASNFGMIINSVNNSKYPRLLFKALTGGCECGTIRMGGSFNLEHEIKWTLQNRAVAAKLYCKAVGVQLLDSGLWLHPSGMFGCSPDYLVGEDKVVEIKCSWKWRNVSVLKEAWKEAEFFVEMIDGEFQLKKDHVYYHQVQGMLHLTKRNFCDLVVWTPSEVMILTIAVDKEWQSNFDKLATFYQIQLLPKLLECL